jgi:AraC-like DNA-binding protein
MNDAFLSTWRAESQRLDLGSCVVEVVTTKSLSRHRFSYEGERAMIAIGLAGERAGGETRTRFASSSHRALEGYVMALPAGEHLEGWSEPATRCSWLILYLSSDYRLADGLALNSLLNRPYIRTNAFEFVLLARRAQILMARRAPGLAAYLQSLVSLILLGEDDDAAAPPDPIDGPLGKRRIARIKRHLETHAPGSVSVADLAALVAMSTDGFIRLFRRTYGVTPHQYLLSKRLDAAGGLLRQTDHALTRIAMETGFASSSHFSAAFRNEFGLTPTEYRRARR